MNVLFLEFLQFWSPYSIANFNSIIKYVVNFEDSLTPMKSTSLHQLHISSTFVNRLKRIILKLHFWLFSKINIYKWTFCSRKQVSIEYTPFWCTVQVQTFYKNMNRTDQSSFTFSSLGKMLQNKQLL